MNPLCPLSCLSWSQSLWANVSPGAIFFGVGLLGRELALFFSLTELVQTLGTGQGKCMLTKVLWAVESSPDWVLRGKSRPLLQFGFWQFDVYLVSFMYFDFYLSIVGMCCPSLSTPFPRRSHCTVPILVLSLRVWMYCSV